jgi:FAD/FMN-containing dehydrogenase/ferredoxin
LQHEEGGVRKLGGGSALHGSSALSGAPSIRKSKRKLGRAPVRKMRHVLTEVERRSPPPLTGNLAKLLKELEGARIEVLLGATERAIRGVDASEPPKILSTILFSDVPALISKPKTHDEVKICVQMCRDLGIPLVVRGAASSAFGAVLPPDGGVVIDVGDMAGVLSIDEQNLLVTVRAGTRWADLSLDLRKRGLALKTSPSSFFSTVAGWFVTGGFGLNSLSFGHIGEHVRQIRVVLPDGGDRFLVPGDRLFDLMIGSEGQMGAVTELTLAVRRQPRYAKTILAQASDNDRAVKLIQSLGGTKDPIMHIMFFDEHRIKEVIRLKAKPGLPINETPTVLIELEADDEEKLVIDLPSDVSRSEAPEFIGNMLWSDRYFPMRGRIKGPGMLGAEVVVPLPTLPEFLSKVDLLGRWFGVEIASEAHILSQKEALVLSFFLTDQRRPMLYAIHAVLSMLVTGAAVALKGRPYAVGVWNQAFSSFVMPEDRFALLRTAKHELDPGDLFNSGKHLSKRTKMPTVFIMLLKNQLALNAIGSAFALASFILRSPLLLSKGTGRRKMSDLELSALACARCGSCVTVCPAYLVTGRETVTGRGKMLIARKLERREAVSQDEAKEMFLCMKCHACEEVCQTRLPLLSAYEELERIIELRFGRPKDMVENFVAEVEASPEYERLLYEGVISPDAGMPDGETDAV